MWDTLYSTPLWYLWVDLFSHSEADGFNIEPVPQPLNRSPVPHKHVFASFQRVGRRVILLCHYNAIAGGGALYAFSSHNQAKSMATE